MRSAITAPAAAAARPGRLARRARAGVPALVALTTLATAGSADAASSTFKAEADAHVSSAAPTSNYGTSGSLKIDGDPRLTGHVRFDVAGLSGSVSRATLRVYVNSSHTTGVEARPVSTADWSESSITHANAPAVSSTVAGRSGSLTKGTWKSIDVTSAVTGTGRVSLALVTSSGSSLLLAARESGTTRAPQLVVETSDAPAPAPTEPAPTEPTPTEPTPTPTPTEPAPSPLNPGDPWQFRPYTASSPWNTPIPAGVAVDPNSSAAVATIGGPVTSDPAQYTYPLYSVDSSTPLRSVRISGRFSDVRGSGTSDETLQILSAPTVQVPARDEFSAAAGTDGQIIIVNPATGDEWGFWQLVKDSAGNWSATNGYHYNVKWDAHPPRSSSGSAFGSRGAGVPYLTGLIRPHEISRGYIDHALAFAYNYASPKWIYPASKSDGKSTDPNALPEGARLQLDPAVTDATLRAAGCSEAAVTIGRAMREYGMYVIDNSGSDKIMLEYKDTANPTWSSLGVGRSTPSCIPVDRLRWVAGPAPIDE